MIFGKRKNAVNEETVKTTTFSKKQISSSESFKDRKDLVNVLLKNDEMYSFDEVDSLIKKFMRGKVK